MFQGVLFKVFGHKNIFFLKWWRLGTKSEAFSKGKFNVMLLGVTKILCF